jgi:hypothetical protein
VRPQATIQLKESCFAGWSGVERCRCEENFRCGQNDKFGESKIDMQKIDNRTREILYLRVRDRAENLATFCGARLRLRFGRFGVKRARALSCICSRGKHLDRAMIRNRQPRAERNHYYQATRGCFHSAFNRRVRAIAQTLSFTSVMGAPPVAVISGGAIGALVSVESVCTRESRIRVDINIALNKSAAARK